MRLIFHLVPRSTWEQTPRDAYTDPSLMSEGFIHCSNADQVERVANLFFASCEELLVLHIDVDRLGAALRDEPAAAIGGQDPFTGEMFPHVYGVIERNAIVAVEALQRGVDGRWEWPARKAVSG